MKISQPSDNPTAVSSNLSALAVKNGPAASTLAKQTATKSTQSAGVSVTVSTLARSLDASGMGEAPDVDMGKVNIMRSAIAEGTYKVNPEVIADRLLSGAQDMLPRNRL